MEIDTVASVSITSLETFNAIEEGGPTLQSTYNGDPIKVCGTTQVQVKHNEQTVTLPLVVTKRNGPTLLGQNWLEALQLD